MLVGSFVRASVRHTDVSPLDLTEASNATGVRVDNGVGAGGTKGPSFPPVDYSPFQVLLCRRGAMFRGFRPAWNEEGLRDGLTRATPSPQPIPDLTREIRTSLNHDF